jgi:hypothetical protein
MNNIDFTYYDKNDDECYQQEILTFLNIKDYDDIFHTIDKLFDSLDFDLTPIYELLKKDKHMSFFSSPDYLFLFLFSYDYLYLFGPLLFSIINKLDYQNHYDKLLEKLNHI